MTEQSLELTLVPSQCQKEKRKKCEAQKMWQEGLPWQSSDEDLALPLPGRHRFNPWLE